MSLTEEVKAKEEVWDARRDTDKLLKEATHALAERTKNLAIAAISGGKVWYAGYANIFLSPEFADLEVCASLFSFLEEMEILQELFFERVQGESPVEVVFGEEIDWPGLNLVGVVATRFNIKGTPGVLGVIGPSRLNYSTVIPILRYFGNLVQEIAEK
jgi:heat-inducible transcriptional repressor